MVPLPLRSAASGVAQSRGRGSSASETEGVPPRQEQALPAAPWPLSLPPNPASTLAGPPSRRPASQLMLPQQPVPRGGAVRAGVGLAHLGPCRPDCRGPRNPSLSSPAGRVACGSSRSVRGICLSLHSFSWDRELVSDCHLPPQAPFPVNSRCATNACHTKRGAGDSSTPPRTKTPRLHASEEGLCGRLGPSAAGWRSVAP